MDTAEDLPNSNQAERGGIILTSKGQSIRAFNRRAIPAEAKEGRWTAGEGHPVRRIDWQAPEGIAARGSLLFLPGRGDFYEKYLETLDHWNRQGWHVTALDWRGQGDSGRFCTNRDVGHVQDFTVWVDDLATFWAEWTGATPGPHVVVAHSMGGHLALRALGEGRIDPQAVVLSAPMLGFAVPGPQWLQQWLPQWLLNGVARIMTLIGDPTRLAWRGSERPGGATGKRQRLLTHDLERYADDIAWRVARPKLALGGASWGWIERAFASFAVLERPGFLEAVETPVLLMGTRTDGLVSCAAIERAARRLPRGELMLYGSEAAHELFREADAVRNSVLQTTDHFLDSVAPRGATRP